jgi:hypothetical protein
MLSVNDSSFSDTLSQKILGRPTDFKAASGFDFSDAFKDKHISKSGG